MRYLCLIYTDETKRPQPGTSDLERVMAGHAAMRKTLDERNAFLGAERLQGTPTARSVRVRNGETIVSDGPFAETKEQLGGYYVIEAKDQAEAVQLAKGIPVPAAGGTVEVRQIVDFA
jgi:hypothetical protein